MTTRTEQAVQRLRSIDWLAAFDQDRQGSAVALFREYCRRMALWADHLNAGGRWPFFSVVEVLVPGFSSATCDEVLSALPIPSPSAERLAKAYLHWAVYADRSSDQSHLPQLPDPSATIPLLFERGCLYFRPENNMLFVGSAGVLLQPWRGHIRQEPFTTLEVQQLAGLDQAYREELLRRTTD